MKFTPNKVSVLVAGDDFVSQLFDAAKKARASVPKYRNDCPECGDVSQVLTDMLEAEQISAHMVCGYYITNPQASKKAIIDGMKLPPPEYSGPHGNLLGHCWVESHNWLIDASADQFGQPPILVVDRDETDRYLTRSDVPREWRSYYFDV
jgi:hypothetical protein